MSTRLEWLATVTTIMKQRLAPGMSAAVGVGVGGGQWGARSRGNGPKAHLNCSPEYRLRPPSNQRPSVIAGAYSAMFEIHTKAIYTPTQRQYVYMVHAYIE